MAPVAAANRAEKRDIDDKNFTLVARASETAEFFFFVMNALSTFEQPWMAIRL